jgi:hypothetical protein
MLTAAVAVLLADVARAQGLVGTLIGTVKDEQGVVAAGARVTVSSPALIGGPQTLVTGDEGHCVSWPFPPASTRSPLSSTDSRLTRKWICASGQAALSSEARP